MRILVFCQYYYPEPFRLNDICEEMVARGHEVTVITGEPNYPEGQIYAGYENHQHAREIINGVDVRRCSIIPRRTGLIYRVLNYFSYSTQAKKYVNAMSALDEVFDVVLVNQLSPVMMAEPAIKYKKKYGVPVILYCLDLWPESLVAGGINRRSFIYKLFYKISKKIYRSVDKILITSKLFRGYLEEKFDIDDEKITYLPQYAEELFEQLPFKENKGEMDLVFAGNIGEIQSVETIVSAAEKMQDKPVRFHIVGGGTDLERLKKLTQGINNITFYGRRPLDEMPKFYANADAMLVTLKADPVLSLTLPGKIQSYMAAGKPIIGAIDGEAATVITEAKCGFCGAAEDVDALVDNILMFFDSTNECKKSMGVNSKLYYERFFNRNVFMNDLEGEFLRYLNSV